MNSRVAKVLEIGCSGIIGTVLGVLLTFAFQFFFPQANEFNFSFNGEEVTMTEADATSLLKENTDLNNQLAQTQNDLSVIQNQLSETQTQLARSQEELQNVVDGTPNVEYFDFDININGEITDKLKKSFLDIDGREFIAFETLNKIINEEVNYTDNVLYIGHSTGKKVDLMDVCPPYDVSNNDYYSTESFEMTGKTYNGFSMVSMGTNYVLVNLDGQYSKIEFDFGHIDGASKYDCTLNIYLDDKLEKTIEQKADSNISHIIIPLNYANHLKFEFNSILTQYGLGNIKLKY